MVVTLALSYNQY